MGDAAYPVTPFSQRRYQCHSSQAEDAWLGGDSERPLSTTTGATEAMGQHWQAFPGQEAHRAPPDDSQLLMRTPFQDWKAS